MNKRVKSKKDIRDLTDNDNQGYGLNVGNGNRYHHVYNSGFTRNFPLYTQQFEISPNIFMDDIVIEMELYLTQKDNQNGILTFIFIKMVNRAMSVLIILILINNVNLQVDIGGSNRKIEIMKLHTRTR